MRLQILPAIVTAVVLSLSAPLALADASLANPAESSAPRSAAGAAVMWSGMIGSLTTGLFTLLGTSVVLATGMNATSAIAGGALLLLGVPAVATIGLGITALILAGSQYWAVCISEIDAGRSVADMTFLGQTRELFRSSCAEY